MGRGTPLTALAAAGAVILAGLAGCTNAKAQQTTSSAQFQPQASPPTASQRPDQPPQPLTPSIEVAGAPDRVDAKGAALYDADNGQLLWSRQIGTERPIGSVTKVMTALVVTEAGGLDRQVRIPKAVLEYVAKYQGESAGLRPGDVLTVRQLLEAMLLASACDAAYVLATTYGPGMPAFLAKMNATAHRLGMLHTHFTSPDGLPYPTEYSTYSTPADLLTLGAEAMKSPVIRSIVDQPFYSLPRVRGVHHRYWWGNTNDLIGSYPGAEGIKTGYTDAARHCLLFAATRHGRILIGVALGSPPTGPATAAIAAARMLNWGFALKTSAGATLARQFLIPD